MQVPILRCEGDCQARQISGTADRAAQGTLKKLAVAEMREFETHARSTAPLPEIDLLSELLQEALELVWKKRTCWTPSASRNGSATPGTSAVSRLASPSSGLNGPQDGTTTRSEKNGRFQVGRARDAVASCSSPGRSSSPVLSVPSRRLALRRGPLRPPDASSDAPPHPQVHQRKHCAAAAGPTAGHAPSTLGRHSGWTPKPRA